MQDSYLTNDSGIFATRLSVLQTALDIPCADLDDNTSKNAPQGKNTGVPAKPKRIRLVLRPRPRG